ncbi:TPA: hypothetical protein I8Y83_002797 [Legionella pneumophila]|uniref:Uncharacterized protein n=1 Tax=Legionella bozemanae TaxID=447 RepID=A0A0W0RBD9_LEGBO|nr:hypothetical protein [Legionella bozemanae]KTC68397.1 hypothetical protein Lboz_3382 [Legionella bozemanae]STP10126.1 Uncharacterised protein [Legionella bozemanae]HAT1722242.1 hypothetical protein [Legionella pneumophila]
MNVIKILMLSMTLLVGNGMAYAEPETGLENNVKLNQVLTANIPMNEEQDVEYFKHIFTNGGLYEFLLALNTEVPELSKTAEYVALYKKLDLTNQVLSQILAELKKNNQLLSQRSDYG